VCTYRLHHLFDRIHNNVGAAVNDDEVRAALGHHLAQWLRAAEVTAVSGPTESFSASLIALAPVSFRHIGRVEFARPD
jgi:hypothetical protein